MLWKLEQKWASYDCGFLLRALVTIEHEKYNYPLMYLFYYFVTKNFECIFAQEMGWVFQEIINMKIVPDIKAITAKDYFI